MHILTDPGALRTYVLLEKSHGKRIALVPTMGALHQGHLSLVDEARKHADCVIVSIFVNPTQFGAGEDLSSYPRPIEEDKALLAHKQVDGVYLPSVEAMYPDGFATSIAVQGGLVNCLCGVSRPGHMDGVALVVTKLFMQVQPDVAVFGEKDFQQLCVIRQLVGDLDIPINIVGAKTLREEDGLALSSRNRYLSENERQLAPLLYQILCESVAKIRQGEKIMQVCEQARYQLIEKGFKSVDYLEVRDEKTLQLQTLYSPKNPARVFAAARLGQARLIDNIPL